MPEYTDIENIECINEADKRISCKLNMGVGEPLTVDDIVSLTFFTPEGYASNVDIDTIVNGVENNRTKIIFDTRDYLYGRIKCNYGEKSHNLNCKPYKVKWAK